MDHRAGRTIDGSPFAKAWNATDARSMLRSSLMGGGGKRLTEDIALDAAGTAGAVLGRQLIAGTDQRTAYAWPTVGSCLAGGVTAPSGSRSGGSSGWVDSEVVTIAG